MPAPRKTRSTVTAEPRPCGPSKAELEAMDVGDRMKRIEPFWQGLSRQERMQMMTVSVAEVKAQAGLVAKRDAQTADAMFARQKMVMQAETGHKLGTCQGECGSQGSCWVLKRGRLVDAIDTRLAEGLKRLAEHNTWAQWQWGSRYPTFYDVDSFREYLEATHIKQPLRKLLPKGNGDDAEQKALKELSERM